MELLRTIILSLNLCTLISTLSCFQCYKAVFNDTNDIRYYDPYGTSDLNTSCTIAPTECPDSDSVKCTNGTLVGSFPDDADYVEVYQCLRDDYDLCEYHSLPADVPANCSYSRCSEDGCNTPPPISCPTCSLGYSDSCGVEEVCPSEECGWQVTECFARFDADSCSLVRGCKEQDYSCGEDGACQTCAPDDCTAAELCSDTNNTCTVYTSCYSCEIDITTGGVWSNEDGLNLSVLNNQCENRTCSKAVTSCKADLDLDNCTVSVGCSDNNTCESQFCELFGLLSELSDIIENKALEDATTGIGYCLSSTGDSSSRNNMTTLPVLIFSLAWCYYSYC